MKKSFHFLFTLIILSFSFNLAANNKPVEFTDPELEKRYNHLIHEIRCLVCQNQSLADSDADLAQDLRKEVYQMLIDGKQDKAIYEFLVERYGDFVLYNPPLQGNTWLLWFGPFLLLLIATIIAVVIIKKQSNETNKNMSKEEQQRLTEILNDDSSEGKK